MYAKCEEYHVPVLLMEAVDGLDIKPDGIYADLTFGGGGHRKAAGCTLEMTMDEAIEKVTAAAVESLK